MHQPAPTDRRNDCKPPCEGRTASAASRTHDNNLVTPVGARHARRLEGRARRHPRSVGHSRVCRMSVNAAMGEPHLVGACSCCSTAGDGELLSCDDCERDLAGLRPAIDLMVVDTCRFFRSSRTTWRTMTRHPRHASETSRRRSPGCPDPSACWRAAKRVSAATVGAVTSRNSSRPRQRCVMMPKTSIEWCNGQRNIAIARVSQA